MDDENIKFKRVILYGTLFI